MSVRDSVNSLLSERHFKAKILKSSQCSSALGVSNQLSFEDTIEASEIGFHPLYSARFYEDKKYKKNNHWQLEAERESVKNQRKPAFSTKLKKKGKQDA